jgi:protein required for attachment to host cells
MKPLRTWILIADAGRARVLENLGPGKGTTPVDALASEALLPSTTHAIVADRQSRSMESANPARHAIESRTDPREQLKRGYLELLADNLDKNLRAGRYDRLIVVAPPSALGVLRSAFSELVKAVVADELAKDLTKTPDHELGPHLADVIRL